MSKRKVEIILNKCANCKEPINEKAFKNLCGQCLKEFFSLTRAFNKKFCTETAKALVEFCNNAHISPITFYDTLLSGFHYIWDKQSRRFFKEEMSEKMLQEEPDICNKFIKFFEKLVAQNNLTNQIWSSYNLTYSERVWLVLYAYLSYSKMPHSVKILFTMLYSLKYYTDDQVLKRLKKIDHYWIYSLCIYLRKDLIETDSDLKEAVNEELIIPLNKILNLTGENTLKYYKGNS